MENVRLTDFLTPAQMKLAKKLGDANQICERVIKPNIADINRKIGQENDPMYLAYVCEYVFSVIR